MTNFQIPLNKVEMRFKGNFFDPKNLKKMSKRPEQISNKIVSPSIFVVRFPNLLNFLSSSVFDYDTKI